MTYDSVNNTVTFSTSGSGWDDAQNSKFLLALEEEIGNPSIKQVSALRRNKMTMRLGLYDWLHPINHADQVALRQTMGHLEAWYASRLLKMTGREINGQITEELADELKSVLDPKMAKRATNIDVETIDDSSQSWMTLALAMACVDDRTARSTQLYAKVVMPAIMEALAVRSIEGETRAIALNMLSRGLQDFTFDDLSGPTQDFFYDTFVTPSGSASVSGWSSAPVKAALGDRVDKVDMANTVDYGLRLWELSGEVRGDNNPATIVGDDLLRLCRDFFAGGERTERVNNFLASAVSEGASEVLGWIKDTFGVVQVIWSQKVEGIQEYSLQTFSMDPSQKLSTAMYGSKFLEDFDNSTIGGRKLDDDEVAVLYSENQAKLADDYHQKSVLEKLFDPSDYRSALSRVARASNWDTSSGSATSHLANIAKTFATAPLSLLSNIGTVLSGQASAASPSPYNYGVSWYGYSADEQEQLRDIDSVQSSVFGNAENLFAISARSGGAFQLNDTASKSNCFSTRIAGNTVLSAWSNFEGVNYLTNSGYYELEHYAAGRMFNYEDECLPRGLSTDELMTLRTYILDYNLLSAGTCYAASAYPDEEFDSDSDGIDDMTYAEPEGLGVQACADFTSEK
jgi:hypothetical protein